MIGSSRPIRSSPQMAELLTSSSSRPAPLWRSLLRPLVSTNMCLSVTACETHGPGWGLAHTLVLERSNLRLSSLFSPTWSLTVSALLLLPQQTICLLNNTARYLKCFHTLPPSFPPLYRWMKRAYLQKTHQLIDGTVHSQVLLKDTKCWKIKPPILASSSVSVLIMEPHTLYSLL